MRCRGRLGALRHTPRGPSSRRPRRGARPAPCGWPCCACPRRASGGTTGRAAARGPGPAARRRRPWTARRKRSRASTRTRRSRWNTRRRGRAARVPSQRWGSGGCASWTASCGSPRGWTCRPSTCARRSRRARTRSPSSPTPTRGACAGTPTRRRRWPSRSSATWRCGTSAPIRRPRCCWARTGSTCGTWTTTPTSPTRLRLAATTVSSRFGTCATRRSPASCWRDTRTGCGARGTTASTTSSWSAPARTPP
mmetsp:Transcript_11980/g.40518  ORF Transcript_11980/g.40518 Transcript_11980/m.40518 type:complete len:252 (-) Transcript_11980:308-1063(-)